MMVTAVELFRSTVEDRRARICQRADGLFQFVTEHLHHDEEDDFSYWRNDYPPSGIFADNDEAVSALLETYPDMQVVSNMKQVSFEIDVGPYPEPDTD